MTYHYHHQKIKRSNAFIKKFKKLYSDTVWHIGGYDLCLYKKRYSDDCYKPDDERQWTAGKGEHDMTPFVFPSRNQPYEAHNIFFTDINLLISRNEDLLRNHYFTMKGYFEKFCHEPFEKAYFCNLQEKRNDKYYGYLKFFYSENQIQRRGQDVCEDDIPF